MFISCITTNAEQRDLLHFSYSFPTVFVQDLHTMFLKIRAMKNLADIDLQGFEWSIGESNP